MKHILSFILICLCLSCSMEPENQAIISGQITNLNGNDVIIKGPDGTPYAQEVSENGEFADTLIVDKANFYTVQLGRQTLRLYLNSNENIHIVMDLEDKEADPTLSGSALLNNQYFIDAQKIDKKYTDDMKTFFSKNEEDFIKTLDSAKTEKLALLSKLKNDTFTSLIHKEVDYANLLIKTRFEQFHAYFSGNNEFKVSENFLSELESIDMDNDTEAQVIPAYRELVYNDFNSKLGKLYESGKEVNLNSIIEIAKEYKSPVIRNEIAKNSLFYLGPGEDSLKTKYENYLSLASVDWVKERITEKYNTIKGLTKGKPSPTFDYENYKGGNTKLEDLSGKYTYIDVWATWCGPCIGEIPSLQKLEEKYHDSNINFVSISIDDKRDYDKWRRMVADKELGGEQLMSDNAWQSEFVKNYAIEGIPRFILIDPQGNIVNADAQRPSNPELEETFESLGI